MAINNIDEKERWKKLLSCVRIKNLIEGIPEIACSTEPRNPFERDCDRITYSFPFRRLQDKTQVIPLPVTDFVHTRLTHTLEVSTVGRSLGRMLENHLIEKKILSIDKKGDLSAIMTAACLSHDIGNPPFGHSGEDSISEYFRFGKGLDLLNCEIKNYNETNIHSIELKENIFQIKCCDLKKFEGNAMGFKIITDTSDSGFNLTCASIASFIKYPRQSYIQGEYENNRWSNRASQKKYGFFFSDREVFLKIANEVGLVPLKNNSFEVAFARHPLAFLMEAADDICYRIIDIEDGTKLGKIPFDEAENILIKIAIKDERFDTDVYKNIIDKTTKFSYLRSKSINVLIHAVFKSFIDNYEGILSGEWDKELIKNIDDKEIIQSNDLLREILEKNVYKWSDVLTIEAAGFEILGGLITEFIEASNICFNCSKETRKKRAEKILELLPVNYRHLNDKEDPYIRYLKVISYVSGMTDNFALNLFRKIKGISISNSV